MDGFIKIIEHGTKYAIAAFVVSLFVLFIPDDFAQKIDLLSLRRTNAGHLWLIFLFTGILVIIESKGLIWRYIVCPIKKLAFPVRDFRSQVKQSRIRYYRVQFLYPNSKGPIIYQGADSNGSGMVGFFDDSGRRIIPAEPNQGYLQLDDGRFHQPKWGKIDWKDIFNGDLNSGIWGIVEP